MNKLALRINFYVRIDDWTAERAAIIASIVLLLNT